MTAGLALAAGLLALPVAGSDVWTAPNLRLDGERAGQVYFQLLVGPDGTIAACDIVYSDFSESVGTQSCVRLSQVVFEQAARDQDGQPVHGIFLLVSSRFARGVRPSDAVNRLLPDLTYTVENLPAAHGTEVLVTVVLQVDPAGRMVTCKGDDDALAALSDAACTQAGSYEYPVVTAASGQPVPYVRELRVNFVEQAQP